jgi:hypothetical protein
MAGIGPWRFALFGVKHHGFLKPHGLEAVAGCMSMSGDICVCKARSGKMWILDTSWTNLMTYKALAQRQNIHAVNPRFLNHPLPILVS